MGIIMRNPRKSQQKNCRLIVPFRVDGHILQLTSEKEPTKIFMHTNIPTESDVKVQQLVQYPQQVEQPVIISDNIKKMDHNQSYKFISIR